MKVNTIKSIVLFFIACIFSFNLYAQTCYINLSEDQFQFDLPGGSAQIDVSPAGPPTSGCSNPVITVYDVPTWLTVSVSGGTIYISTNSSLSSGYRTAGIPVRVNGITVNGFTVTQGTETTPPPPPPPSCSVTGFGGTNSSEMFGYGGGVVVYPLTFTDCSQSSATFSFTNGGTQAVPNWIILNQTGSSISVNCLANTGPGRSAVIVATATIGGQQVTMAAQISQGTCLSNWYLDSDGDGFGDPNTVVADCDYPDDGSVYVDNNLDCDDTRRNINPQTKWYADTDNDGFGEHNGNILTQCTRPNGYSDNNDDWCPGVTGQDYGCPNQTGVYNENYIHTISPQVPMTNLLDRSNNDNFIESINYYDDLGRPKQSIAKQAGGNRQDIITPIVYDTFGKQTKEYLPYANPTPTTPSLVYRDHNTLLQNLTNYYSANYSEDINSANPNPNSDKEIERSPLNRILKQAAPGEDWALGSGHEIEFDYKTNIASDEVRLFSVNLTTAYVPTLVSSGSSYYTAGALYKTITRDENHVGMSKNHSTEEFKDKQGRVVLKRTYTDSDLNNNGTIGSGETEIAHDTYYVYDKFGNLTYVIPPKVNTADGVSVTELNELCYQYRYDERNRLIEKKIPGKGTNTNWEEIVYNKLDQPILTRDPNLKAQDKALFTKYDAFGRVAYTGQMNVSGTTTRSSLQTTANGFSPQYENKNTSATTYAGTPVYYSKNAYPTSFNEVHTINYYDNYTFDLAGLALPTGSIFEQTIATGNQIKGLATGSKVRILGTNHWITTITLYDKKGQAIYTASKNDYLNTIDIVQTQYDFAGKVLKTWTRHQKGSEDEIVTLDMFTYDHVGRLLTQKQCIGDDSLPDNCNGGATGANLTYNSVVSSTINTMASNSITLNPGFHVIATSNLSFSAKINTGGELIAENHYDELGQLDKKKVGNKTTAPLQTVDYTYNIRGWLKNINQDSYNDNDLFNFTLKYNNPTSGTALYNGNISQTVWNTLSVNPNPPNNPKSVEYTYSYDALNRLLTATDNTGNYNVSGISYDKNGNIKNLTRKGLSNPVNNTFGNMDILTYSYDSSNIGNKLVKVEDSSGSTEGFKNGSNTAVEYQYDANGNMTKDLNKGIGTTSVNGIVYNHLNLPTEVKFNNSNTQKINYIYSANGAKLQKIVNENGNITTTDYAGNYVYENSSLKFFNTPEGYVEPVSSSAVEGYRYIYQYKDHLGNIRLSYSDTDKNGSINATTEIIEENNYYPFGMKHEGYNNNPSAFRNSVASKFKYNGIELEESLGMNLYEMDVRSYDPAIARWTSIDPLTHYSQSTYTAFDNNPVFWADPMGTITVNSIQEAWDATSEGSNSSWFNDGNGGLTDDPQEGQTKEGLGYDVDIVGVRVNLTTYYYHAGGLNGSDAGWYTEAQYAQIIRSVAFELALRVYGWNSKYGTSIMFSGFLDSFIESRTFVNGYFGFLLEYGNYVKGEEERRSNYMASGHIKPMGVDSPFFMGAFGAANKFLRFKGAAATSSLPMQLHHFATNKNKVWTPLMENIAGRFGLSLNGAWNTRVLPHIGRHPNEYHKFVYDGMVRAAAGSGGSQAKFIQLFQTYVKNPVIKNPQLLRKAGWQ